MWDDATESWWQQVTGEAVVGEMAGARLEFIPAFLTSFAEFVRTYPNGTVLSPESTPPGFHGGYGLTAYLNYDWPNNRPYLFYGELDQRLDPVARVLGVEAGGQAIAFPFADLKDARVTETTVGRPGDCRVLEGRDPFGAGSGVHRGVTRHRLCGGLRPPVAGRPDPVVPGGRSGRFRR